MSNHITIKDNIIKPLLNCKNYGEIMLYPERHGDMTEKLCIILIATKCADNILEKDYVIQDGNFEDPKYPLKNYKSIKQIILELPLHTGGDKSDITLKDILKKFNPISVKTGLQGEIPSKTDCTFLRDRLKDTYNQPDTLPILICDDKTKIIKSSTGEARGNKQGKDKEYHTEMILQDKIKDKSDIKQWINIFHKKYGGLTVEEFIEKVDSEILNNHKKFLKIRLHQEITKLKIMRLINGGRKQFVIAHKPRSGKSYLILYLLNILINQGKINRVLIWTSVKDTIKQFTDIIDSHYDFNNLKYLVLKSNKNLDEEFKGIAFTTSQYLKCDKNGLKKEFLQNNNFDCIVIDESHWGSSTTKTASNIIHTIMKNSLDKYIFYLSATPRKTIDKYNIPAECVFKWDIIDEGYMKNIEMFKETMIKKHGKTFIDVYNDNTISKDYSNCPIPILIRPDPKSLKELSVMIINYNNENNTELGLSFKSLFALEIELVGRKKVVKEKFKLQNTNRGIKILEFFLKLICDEGGQGETILETIDSTQNDNKSRTSKDNDPKGCLLFTPDMGNIDIFQKTLIKFIKERELFSDYHIDYCNCKKSNKISETYENALINCRNKNKQMLLFLLNQQGGLGITYKDCDSVIMLDDSDNPEQYYQRIMRCMTESKDKYSVKKCGVIVDFNWKRQLMWINDLCKQVQNTNVSHKSKKEILIELIEYNIFKINPKKHKKFGWNGQDISEYMDFISKQIQDNTDENDIWSSWSCPDTLDITKLSKSFNFTNDIPEQLQGQGNDIPDASTEITEVLVDDDENDIPLDSNDNEELYEEDIFTNDYINKTEQFLKDRIFWIFALKMSKDKNCNSFQEVIDDEYCNRLIEYMIEQTDIKGNYDNIICSILYIMNTSNTKSRMDELIELYENTPMKELRYRIDKHVKATEEERKKNAEVHTCYELVDKLIDLVPNEIWLSPHKVADLSCGKGNILRGIFKSFFDGLEEYEPETIKRCELILKECIYISDIEPINVWITEVLLCLEAQSYCSIPYTEFLEMVNKNTGDSLELDIKDEWDLDGFDVIIENPPYNKKNANGKTVQGKSKLYGDFMEKDLTRLKDGGYLVYVTPSGWITGTMKIFSEVIKYNLKYLNMNKVKETYFPNIGDTLCYYSICKEPNKFQTELIDNDGNKLIIPFKERKLNKLFPVIFTKYNLNYIDKILTTNDIYNGFINIKEWKEGNRDNMREIKDEEYKYEIREFKTGSISKYTNIHNENTYNKKFIIYEICGSLDFKYYNTPVYAGSHTFYLEINNDNYGKLLEKWFGTNIFKNLYDITKSSQYLKNGLVKHIKLPPESILENINIDTTDFEEYQKKFYNLE